MNILHLVGPPGTGKTTAILDKISQLLTHGVEPNRIGFCSFTKAAVRVAKGRMRAELGIHEDELCYFGTLHSLAFRHLGLTRDQVVGGKWWGDFCKAHHLPHSDTEGGVDDDLFEPLGTEEGDILRRFHQWHQDCRMPMESALKVFDPGLSDAWSPARQVWFSREYEAAKTAASKWDFTDMLLELSASEWIPEATVLVVDEAQDLSPLQQEIVLRWAQAIRNLLLAYDPDQAIYTFCGASPEWLLALEGRREFLTQSWRVPARPAALCRRVIERNRTRYRNEWRPREEPGSVEHDAFLPRLVNSAANPDRGSWYFLARNRYYLNAYTDALRDAGVPYHNLRGPSPHLSTAVKVAFQLADGQTVPLAQVEAMADKTTARDWWTRGAKADLKRAAEATPARPVALADLEGLGALPPLAEHLGARATCLLPLKVAANSKDYFDRVVRRYGLDGLDLDPWVSVSTMHGVKGGEADNNVLSPMMTRRTSEGYEDDPEPERRVWYVGASRTRRNLFILEPEARGAFFEDW